MVVFTLADLQTKFSSACPLYGTLFLHFHQKVPTLQVHVPPKVIHAPNMGNSGSAPSFCLVAFFTQCLHLYKMYNTTKQGNEKAAPDAANVDMSIYSCVLTCSL